MCAGELGADGSGEDLAAARHQMAPAQDHHGKMPYPTHGRPLFPNSALSFRMNMWSGEAVPKCPRRLPTPQSTQSLCMAEGGLTGCLSPDLTFSKDKDVRLIISPRGSCEVCFVGSIKVIRRHAGN